MLRSGSEQSPRIAAENVPVAEATVGGAEKDRAAVEAEKEARVAANSSETEEKPLDAAEAAEAALVAADRSAKYAAIPVISQHSSRLNSFGQFSGYTPPLGRSER